ncbi:MAG: MFS transporter [Actinobacteria bacterium]|nr:MFS transporter [Actinomycetota bacterium]
MSALRDRLADSLRAFRAVFTNPNLRRVQLAWVGSETGKWLYLIALAVYAYEAGGAAGVGLVALIRTIPTAIAAPFAALLGDRYRRERVMLAATLVRLVTITTAAAAVAVDAPALVVYGLAAFVTLVSTAFRPAQAALLPSLARTPEELTAANVASSTVASVASFIGPAVGGVLLAATSTEIVFLATGGTFLWTAVMVAGIKPGETRRQDSTAEPSGIVGEALAGFRTILVDKDLRLFVGLYGAQAFVGGTLSVLIVVSALELLDLGESGVGFLNSAFGIGGVLGTVVALALVARQKLASDFIFGILLWGVPLALMGLWPNPFVAVVLLGLIGVGETIVEVAGPTLLQRSVPDDVLARVFGALESLLVTTIGLGGMVAPVLIAVFGIRGALGVSGAILPLLALVFWRRLVAIDAAAPAVERQLALLRGAPMFAPLPPATLEQLAGSVALVHVQSGEEIFRQGDPGERFYLIDRGEVEVAVDGRPTRTLGPGDFFGEIALLREVPRTATVTAREVARLYALERDEFIAAVTGHAPSMEAADGVISARLGAFRSALAPE